MRYLHRVAESERFIAKGVYRSYEGDALLPGRESWTRHRLAGGGILTRIDCDYSPKTILAEVLTDESGQIERLHVREWNTAPQATYHALRADYIFFSDYVQVTRRLDEAETDHHEVRFPPHTIINLPFTLYVSVKFKRMAEDLETNFSFLVPTWHGAKKDLVDIFQDVPRPDQGPFGDISRLTPRYSKIPTVVYYATLGRYVAVDEHDIPLQFQDGDEITILTEYAHI
jgi:hypothetical protein